MRENCIAKIIFSSTAAVYDKSEIKIEENFRLNPFCIPFNENEIFTNADWIISVINNRKRMRKKHDFFSF